MIRGALQIEARSISVSPSLPLAYDVEAPKQQDRVNKAWLGVILTMERSYPIA